MQIVAREDAAAQLAASENLTGRGKGTAYESGARVPIAVRGPGIEAGGRNTAFVHAADLFSTILGLAGLESPETVPNRQGTAAIDLDSVSLMPILFDGASTVRDPNEGYLLTEMATGARQMVGARNARYKVVCMDSAEDCEFYDLIDDPLEEYPLAKPRDCANAAATWTTADSEWHYCRLTQVVATESFFADTEARAARAAARGAGAGPRGRGAGGGARGAGPGGRGGARGGARGGRFGGRGAAPN